RQIDAPEERLAHLQAACSQDQAGLHRLQELLRVYDQERSFLESPAAGLLSPPGWRGVGGEGVGPTLGEPIAERPGTVIGPYKLLEQIGEGGMGTVWMGQQTQPVKRLVAVKLIKAGMDSGQVTASFERGRRGMPRRDTP